MNIVSQDGRVQFGLHSQPISEINAGDYTLKTPVGGYDNLCTAPGHENRFDQLFGHFSGQLLSPEVELRINALWGFAERQYTVW